MFANDLLSRKAIGLYIEHTIELELGSVLRAESFVSNVLNRTAGAEAILTRFTKEVH